MQSPRLDRQMERRGGTVVAREKKRDRTVMVSSASAWLGTIRSSDPKLASLCCSPQEELRLVWAFESQPWGPSLDHFKSLKRSRQQVLPLNGLRRQFQSSFL